MWWSYEKIMHLVRLLLSAGLHIGVVVAGPVPELLLLHYHHVCAHAVEEVLRVADHYQDLLVGRQIVLLHDFEKSNII